jgi:UDP:flavonoid glycosyltransferase YjiC (YdhE family)
MGSPPVLEESAMTEAKPEIDRLGLPGFPEAALTLDVCPPSVRRSDSAEATSLRYVPYNGVAVLPSWLLEPRDRPRVCLTLGTQVPLRGGLPMMAQLMATLTSLGLEVVVAVDDAVADQLEPRPEGVRAVGRLPLNLVLPHCDLVVHHCGSGTTMTSLTAGVPQLIIPVIAETWDFARRLAGFGSAREIKPADTDQATVVEACTALLDDPAPRAAAGALRDEIAAMPSPAQTVPVLEELVRSGGGSR